MSKLRFSLLVCLVIIFLLSACKKKDDPTSSDGNDPTITTNTGGKLVDKVIDASVQDVSVSVQGKISVVIPKGMAPANTTVTIEKIDAAGLPKDTKFDIYDVYEVKLSSGSSFATPLKITLNYDASKVPTGKFRNKIGAAYLDETAKIWKVFSDCVVDTINHSMTFPTNHLTKLSTWGMTSLTSVYTDYFSTTHFNIYWQTGKVYTNTEYKTSFPTAGSNPDYIKDIGRYLEDSYDKYKTLGLTVPTLVKVDVYLTGDLGEGVDGLASFLGYIYLSNKIQGDGKLTPELMVPIVCAHEFLHYVQDYYYVQIVSDISNKWWLEATATQGDRMVWPTRANFESLLYSDKLIGIMYKSWDDCNSDPDWYTAGCFMAYLSAYRTGNAASIAEMIKLGGSKTSALYIRTIVDTYLKTTTYLSSQGIGIEYLNYIKWAFESKGAIKLASTKPTQKQSNLPYIRTVFAPLVAYSKEYNESFPYLSVRSIKIAHDENVDPKGDVEKEITITAKDLSNEVLAYVYKMGIPTQPNPITLVQQLKKTDAIKLTLPKGGTNWIEVLLVNTSKDDAKNFDIETKTKVLPYITAISPVKPSLGGDLTITGTSFGAKESTSDIYFNTVKVNALSTDVKSWSDTQIVVKVPANAATGTIYLVTKDGTSNSVSFEVVFNPTTISGFMHNLMVTYVDQDKRNTTGYGSINLSSSSKISWTGNTFSFTYTVPKTPAVSFDKTWTVTGTLSADLKTLVSLNGKENDVAKSGATTDTETWTREVHKDTEFSILNVPRSDYTDPNAIRFHVTGTAISNYSPKYSYSETWLTLDNYFNGATGKEYLTTTSVSFQTLANSEFDLILQ